MKKRKFLCLMVTGVAGWASPGTGVAGGMTGGATELTQIANNMELMLMYATQVEQYLVQLKQLQHDIMNVAQLAFPGFSPEVGNMIKGVGALMTAGKAIGSNLADMNKNFASNFKNAIAGDLASKFSGWHQTSIDTLEGALKTAGLHNEMLATDTAKIQALYDKASKTNGNVQALHALAQIATTQVEHTQRLSSLIATQNIAATTYMAQQTSKNKAREERAQKIMGDGVIKMPADGTAVPGLK